MRDADPENFDQAVRSTQKEQWKTAMREELRALEENGVWNVVRLYKDVNSLHTKKILHNQKKC